MIKANRFHSFVLKAFFIFCTPSTFAQVSVKGSAPNEEIQNPKTAIGKVLYNFSYVKDTTHRDYRYTETFELAYAENASYFSSYTAKENDSMMKNQIAAAFKNAPDPDHVDITITGMSSSRDKFFTEKNSSVSVYEIKNLAGTTFILKSSQPKINWQIIDSTKIIQGYLCQKATGKSYGRNYTAWFCTDLPYSFGPRRLNNLPGLILEAYDDKMDVIYRLNRVENFNAGIDAIGLPSNAENTTYTALKKAEEAFKKNPQPFIDADRKKRAGAPKPKSGSLTDGFDVSKIKSISVKKANSGPKNIVANNPIDLITEQ